MLADPAQYTTSRSMTHVIRNDSLAVLESRGGLELQVLLAGRPVQVRNQFLH